MDPIKKTKDCVQPSRPRKPSAPRPAKAPFLTRIAQYGSLGTNLVFVALKISYSIRYHSIWYGALGVYYILLAIMRFLLLPHIVRVKTEADIIPEWKLSRRCGVILILITTALAGMVTLVMTTDDHFHYTSDLIYVLIIYAIYCFCAATVDLVKYRKSNYPAMSTSKTLKLVTAIVSIWRLSTAMLFLFGNENETMAYQTTTAVSGWCVCLLILLMALHMIRNCHKINWPIYSKNTILFCDNVV